VSDTRYRSRRAAVIENGDLRVAVLQHGGHIAEIFDKAAGVSPLWTPPWPTIEPSEYGHAHAALYGHGSDARLLAGIMGHSLCLDLFGPPSEEDAARGLGAHGEGSVAAYDLDASGQSLVARARFPIAGLEFGAASRCAIACSRFASASSTVGIGSRDGWTEHVTLGPPFLQRAATQFRASATHSKVFESKFGADDYLRESAEFEWPFAPRQDGRRADLQVFTDAERSSAFTTHLMDRDRRAAYFVAFAPAFDLAFGYVWDPTDFPWLGIWEENHSRLHQPWNGQTLARGMEFGVSPVPETREAMIARRHRSCPFSHAPAALSRWSIAPWCVARRRFLNRSIGPHDTLRSRDSGENHAISARLPDCSRQCSGGHLHAFRSARGPTRTRSSQG
jgi:hypothetical protein